MGMGGALGCQESKRARSRLLSFREKKSIGGLWERVRNESGTRHVEFDLIELKRTKRTHSPPDHNDWRRQVQEEKKKSKRAATTGLWEGG